jgi:uncharacterized protein (DUF983 family)
MSHYRHRHRILGHGRMADFSDDVGKMISAIMIIPIAIGLFFYIAYVILLILWIPITIVLGIIIIAKVTIYIRERRNAPVC